jgi:hypothetical protein
MRCAPHSSRREACRVAGKRRPGDVGPRGELLAGGLRAGAAGEADVGGVAANNRGNVDHEDMRPGSQSDRVGEGKREVAPVVGQRNVEVVPAMQIDPRRREIDGGKYRRRAVNIETGGVRPFALIVKQIELDGYAVGDASVPELAPGPADSGWTITLDSKGNPVAARVRQLEGKVGGELLDIDRSRIEGAARFVRAAIGQLQPVVVQIRAAIELNDPVGKCKAVAKVENAGRLNGIGGAHNGTRGLV